MSDDVYRTLAEVLDDKLPDYTRFGLEPFRYETEKGKIVTMSYYPLPAEVMEDQDMMTAWARKAMAVALKAKKS